LLMGFEIAFDKQGELTVNSQSELTGGSKTARDLLTMALASGHSVTIESANHAAGIAFAQLDSELRCTDGSGRYFEDWRIRIDFADFTELRGDQAAIASFGPGMGFMHELTHAILRYTDPVTANDQLGDCERYLNRIRAELNLPQRVTYYPATRLTSVPESLSQVNQGTLTFGNTDEISQTQKTLLVTFNLERVFDLRKARRREVAQAELLVLRLT